MTRTKPVPAPSEQATCPRCQNRRLIDREPGARLKDGRPDWVCCPKCLGAGPVAEQAPVRAVAA